MSGIDPRYRRQLSLVGFGAPGQEALLGAHVAIIGAGGLGAPSALYLAAAGVGHLTLFDDDLVDRSNLQRQIIHADASVGKPKVDSARAQLLALNPTIEVTAVHERLEWPGALTALDGVDVVIDGSDNFDTRHVVSAACARLGIPHVWASILGFDAQLSVFHAGHGPIYEDIFPNPPAPGVVPNCAQAGVLGPLVGVIGSAMALEAIKLIAGIGTALRGTLGYYSGLDGRWEYIPLQHSPATVERLLSSDPPRQARTPQVPEVTVIPEGALLIDVREPHETATTSIPGALFYPLGQILDGFDPPELLAALSKDPQSGALAAASDSLEVADYTGQDPSPVVIYCAGGVRSARAVAALSERGIIGPVSLAGGIDGWLESQT